MLHKLNARQLLACFHHKTFPIKFFFPEMALHLATNSGLFWLLGARCAGFRRIRKTLSLELCKAHEWTGTVHPTLSWIPSWLEKKVAAANSEFIPCGFAGKNAQLSKRMLDFSSLPSLRNSQLRNDNSVNVNECFTTAGALAMGFWKGFYMHGFQKNVLLCGPQLTVGWLEMLRLRRKAKPSAFLIIMNAPS